MDLPPFSPSQTSNMGSDQTHKPMRLSCDACAAAKVKCDKVRPCCGRCVGPGKECVYGVSRKHGKARLKRQRDHDQRNMVRKDLAPKDSTISVSDDLAGSAFHTLLEDFPPDVRWIAGTNLGNENREPWDELTPSSLFHVDEPSFPSNHSSNRSVHSVHSSGTDYFSSVPNDTPPASSTPINMLGLTDPDTAPSVVMPRSWTPWQRNPENLTIPHNRKFSSPSVVRPDYTESCSCYTFASSTLKSLHYPFCLSTTSRIQKAHSSISSSPGSPSSLTQLTAPVTLTLDHVLRNNKVAIGNIRQLLECQCASDPHLAMLYASIMSKILIWYQIAGGVKSPISAPNAQPSIYTPCLANDSFIAETSKPSGINPLARYIIALLPRTIGEFDLDEEDQKKLGRQLLLGELRKAGHVIDSFARRQFSNDGNVDEGTSDLCGMIGAWLKSELSRTIREIKKGIMVVDSRE